MSVDTFESRLLDDLAPFVAPAVDPNGDHAVFLAALAAMFEPVFSLAMDQGFPDDGGAYVPGWGALFDVDLCPAQYLPYLAQFVGVTLAPGLDDATSRQIIRAEQGMQRGTPASIIAAAERNLTGTQTVILQERTAASGSPDPYHVVLEFLTAELATTEQDLINAVEAVKPAGIQITYVSSAGGFVWSTALHKWSADTFSWDAAFSTQP